MKDYPIHPAAKLFPMFPPKQLQELADSIKKHGLIHPITLLDGAILDGRNRFVACGMADVQPRFEDFNNCNEGDLSPTEWVLASNADRRHLTPGEKAAVAVASLPLLEAEAKERQRLNAVAHNTGKPNKEIIPDSGQARDKAAAALGVNPRYVSDAKKIKEESPETFEKVASGEITIPDAKRILAALKEADAESEAETERDEFYKRDAVDGGGKPEQAESTGLFQLNFAWKRATKREKSEFWHSVIKSGFKPSKSASDEQ